MFVASSPRARAQIIREARHSPSWRFKYAYGGNWLPVGRGFSY